MNNALKPKPIFVVGAARNGTTNLCNLLSEIPSISGVTSIFHYGTCESNILRNKLFWGDLSNFNNFLNLIAKIQFDDFFTIAKADVDYFLKNKPDNYYTFFFELMDRFANSNGSKYWVTKIDPLFFVYPKSLADFSEALKERYGDNGYEIIWIKRSLKESLVSYISMEGNFAKKRKNIIFRVFSIFLETIRHLNVYITAEKFFPNISKINFEDYKKNNLESINKIDFIKNLYDNKAIPNYEINSSFIAKKKHRFSSIDKLFMNLGRLMINLDLGQWLLRFYESRRGLVDPTFHRIFMYKYFREELKRDLKNREAFSLMKTLKL